MIRSDLKTSGALASLAVLAASAAHAQGATMIPPPQRLSFTGVFANAAAPVKVIMAGLVIAIVVALALWALKLARKAPPGEFLSALPVAGPLFGLAAAAYGLMTLSIGLANVRPSPGLTTLAPGLAEAALTVLLGLLAGAVAATARGHLQSRAV
jgi:hypothetical protein